MAVRSRCVASMGSPALQEPSSSPLGDRPGAPRRIGSEQAFLHHAVPRPLGGVTPPRIRRITGERLPVQILQDWIHHLAHAIKHFPHLAATTCMLQDLEYRQVVGRLWGALPPLKVTQVSSRGASLLVLLLFSKCGAPFPFRTKPRHLVAQRGEHVGAS